MDIQHFFQSLHGEHLRDLIQWGGFLLLFAIIFAETGLLVGFFLPGDSLLFTAGAVVGVGLLKAPAPLPQDPVSSLVAMIILLCVAAIAGDATGYWFGYRTGARLYQRPDGRFFKKKYLYQAEAFYQKHGPKTIILARWVPIVRTFAPIVAGVARMEYRTFAIYNVVGGITWVGLCSVAGFMLGNIAWVSKNFEKVILAIIVLSVLPAFAHVAKEMLAHRKETATREDTASSAEGAEAVPEAAPDRA